MADDVDMGPGVPPQPLEYIALPAPGIQNQVVRNYLQGAALADFRHDFSGLRFADALRDAIDKYRDNIDNIDNRTSVQRNQRIGVIRGRLGGVDGSIATNFTTRAVSGQGEEQGSRDIQLSLPNGIDLIHQEGALSEDEILDQLLLPAGISFAGIKQILANRPFVNPPNLAQVRADFNPLLPPAVGRDTFVFQQKPYQLRCFPVKWKIDDQRNYIPLPSAFLRVINAEQDLRTVLIIDASFFAFGDLLRIPLLDDGIQHDIYIISNIENDSDPATKIKKIIPNIPNIPNINVYFLKERDPNHVVSHSLINGASNGNTPVFFSKYSIQSRRNETAQVGNIDATILDANQTIFQTINNLGSISEINQAGIEAVTEILTSNDIPGPAPGDQLFGQTPLLTAEKMMNYFMLKRAGDWCQALSLADTTREYHVYDNLFQPINDDGVQRVITLQGLQKTGHEIALVTHDRILLAFALYKGINVIFSLSAMVSPPHVENGISDVNWMLYFKNMLSADEEGAALILQRLIDEKKNNIQGLIEDILGMQNIQGGNIQGILEGLQELQRIQRVQFIEKVVAIMNTYVNPAGGLILPFLTDTLFGSPENTKTLDTDLNFRNYIRYLRLALYQLSILTHPIEFQNLPLLEAPLTLNDWSAIENYVRKIKDAIQKNNGITPGQILGQILDATPLPPNDNNENNVIDQIRIMNQPFFYDNYEISNSGLLPQAGGAKRGVKQQKKMTQKILKQSLKSSWAQKPQKRSALLPVPVYASKILNGNKISGSSGLAYEKFKKYIIYEQIHTYFRIVNDFQDVEGFEKEVMIINPIQNIIPYQLGDRLLIDLRGDRKWKRHNYKTVHNDIFMVFGGPNALLQGGAHGDNLIKSRLKMQTMNTIPLGNVVQRYGIGIDLGINGNDVILINRYKQYIYNKSNGGNIQWAGIEDTILNGLIENALRANLREPLFTAYIENEFRNVYDEYINTRIITRSQIGFIDELLADPGSTKINQYRIVNRGDYYDYKPRGSSYYDIHNNKITVVDNIVIDSRYENSFREILNSMRGGVQFTNTRKDIPFFVYRFLIYYIDKILQRIQKLSEEPLVEESTEETLVEKYKLHQELNAFFGNIYINQAPYLQGPQFNLIENNFLFGIDILLPHNQIEDNLSTKQGLYNQAKIAQFIHMIYYYIWMYQSVERLNADAQINSISEYLIPNMIGENRIEFLKRFLEIDEVLFQAPPDGVNLVEYQQSQPLVDARRNIIEKGLLRNFRDYFAGPPQPPAPAHPTQLEALVTQLGFYNPQTIRNYIVRPILQSLNNVIIGVIPEIVGIVRINIQGVAPQVGGRRTRKQRKTHKGIKTRSAKPRKQSARRHKKYAKKTRKH